MSVPHEGNGDDDLLLPATVSFKRRPLDWLSLSKHTPPPREWAIRHWLGMAFLTLLIGPAGRGKTLLAQMLGTALALGVPFIDEVPVARRVLAWFGEDDHDELWRRQCDIAAYFGADLGDLHHRFIAESYVGRDCVLMDRDLAGGRLVKTAMLDELREQVGDYKADVVILDNVAKLFGGNENDRSHVTRFIDAVTAAAPGAAILLLAHPGRREGSEYSGSSAWEAAARSRMFLSDHKPDDHRDVDDDREPDSDLRYLARRKANYASRDLRSFRYENGILRPLEPAAAPGGLMSHLEHQRDERIVLEAFKRLTNGLNQQPTDAQNAATFLPKLILQFDLGEGRSRHDLTKAMRRLQTDGKLRRDVVGKYGNRGKKMGLVLGEDATECTT